MGRVITQIRLSLSFLNNQLFTYNLSDNHFCAMCGNEVETPLHFFRLCPVYKEQRTILLGTIYDIINSITNTYGVIIDFNTHRVLLDLFLKGFNVPQLLTNINHNIQIFKAVSCYIVDSTRLSHNQQ